MLLTVEVSGQPQCVLLQKLPQEEHFLAVEGINRDKVQVTINLDSKTSDKCINMLVRDILRLSRDCWSLELTLTARKRF